ncbi:MAG: NAD(P)H-dependent oxidoreductase [Coriobacteriales bacterium]|jgi:hypothetical protein|nr:NAD(P)H-dependent oxidoreductase [Coriobacteriales bacterium]
MKVALVNGSPKRQGSASGILVAALQDRLGPTAECVVCHAATQGRDEALAAFAGCGALVFVFPLYVDGIPSHLLRLLDEMQGAIVGVAPDATVCCVVNNGFYEAHQNKVALEMMGSFCVRSGLRWGQGLGVGAGGMIAAAPIGRGPLKGLGRALDELAGNILASRAADDRFVGPGFPRFLYQAVAHQSWRLEARQNGLKARQLYDRPQG